MSADYNSTIILPKTSFSMKAGLATKEPQMREAWDNAKLYESILNKGENSPLFILHDGPPYANGDVHMGTAMNKVLKDMIIRYKTMSGYKSPYLPGWDTHGLPIELKALEKAKKDGKKSTDISKLELRKLCREYALHFIDVQRSHFKRLGVLGEFDNPYMTLTPDFEARQIKVFGEMIKKGYIYKGKKAVYWCSNDKTALAEAEIEYAEDPCVSIYVSFNVTDDNGALAAAGVDASKTKFVIWTTTAWTIPGNMAICLGRDFEYAVVKVGESIYIIADELVKETMSAAGITDYSVVTTITGDKLEGIKCAHPHLDRSSLVILGDHVTLESGTGCVHTAPGHGADDFEVCTKFYPEIPVIVPVDEAGIMTEEAGIFAGQPIAKCAKSVIEHLESTGHLLAKKELIHQYPHCWRCKHPILFRTTEQWFCSVEAFKDEAIAALRDVKFTPEWGKDRLTGMVRDRYDWCISRQRTWGVPIPVFYCDDCGAYHADDATITAVSELFAKEGSDAWYKYEASDILPAGTACPKCSCTSFTKESDIMDVWFDSGTTHTCLDEAEGYRWPADLYLEGADQFRGWFQSSLLTAVPYKGAAPYKGVLTHGWVVDGEGRKMSKSLGNGILATEVIKDYGADILRLWVASTDYQTDVRVSKDILKQCTETYRKIRNTARFILGNLADYNPSTDRVPTADLPELDRFVLSRLNLLIEKCTAAFDAYEFHTATHAIHQYCIVELSNFYLDIIKDTLYCEERDSKKRRSAQTVIERILSVITRLLAPILCYTTDEIWQHLCAVSGEDKHVALTDFPQPDTDAVLSKEIQELFDSALSIKDVVAKALETARAEKVIGSSLEASVKLTLTKPLFAQFSDKKQMLIYLLIVSDLQLVEGENDIVAEVKHAEGEKCMRCWCFNTEPVQDGEGILCARCNNVVKSL